MQFLAMPWLLLIAQDIAPPFSGLEGVPDRELRALPAIDLTLNDSAPNPIRDTWIFTPVGDSRIAFIRRSDEMAELVVVDTTGAVLHELRLPEHGWDLDPFGPSRLSWRELSRISDDRVLLLAQTYCAGRDRGPWFVPPTPTLWLARLRSGTVVPFGYEPEDLALVATPTRDEGFVIGTNRQSEPRLYGYDGVGRLRWRLDLDDGLCDFTSLCVLSDGRIAALSSDPEPCVQFIAPEGRILGRALFSERWPQVVGRPSNVLAATDGGMFVRTWRERWDLVRCLPDLTPRNSIPLDGIEDRRIDSRWQSTPTGVVWCTDGQGFRRIADSGVDLVVGEPPDGRNLRRAELVRIGPDDRIYALTARGRFLHVFDASGIRTRVVPSERVIDVGLPAFLNADREIPEEESWPRAGARGRWVLTKDVIRLEDAKANTIREIAASDLGLPECRALSMGLAIDGSVHLSVLSEGELRIFVLDSDGRITFRWEWPYEAWPSGVDYDGERFAVAFPEGVAVFDRNGRPLFRATLERTRREPYCMWTPDETWKVHLARRGKELWVRKGVAATRIERYEMP